MVKKFEPSGKASAAEDIMGVLRESYEGGKESGREHKKFEPKSFEDLKQAGNRRVENAGAVVGSFSKGIKERFTWLFSKMKGIAKEGLATAAAVPEIGRYAAGLTAYKTVEAYGTAKQKTGEAWESAKQKTGESYESIKAKAGQNWESGKIRAGAAYESGRVKAGAAYEGTKQKAVGAYEFTADAAIYGVLASGALAMKAVEKYDDAIEAAKSGYNKLERQAADAYESYINKIQAIKNKVKEKLDQRRENKEFQKYARAFSSMQAAVSNFNRIRDNYNEQYGNKAGIKERYVMKLPNPEELA